MHHYLFANLSTDQYTLSFATVGPLEAPRGAAPSSGSSCVAWDSSLNVVLAIVMIIVRSMVSRWGRLQARHGAGRQWPRQATPCRLHDKTNKRRLTQPSSPAPSPGAGSENPAKALIYIPVVTLI